MKDVLMVVHTMGNLLPSDNDRFTYLAKLLMKSGAEVEIVTSDFEHHKKRYRETGISALHPFKITFLHEDSYKKNVSLARIKGHASFAKKLKKYLSERKNPDIIYCAVPPIVSALEAGKYAKENNIPFVIDIQDLWPESFAIALGDSPIVRMLLKPLTCMADRVYKYADSIVAVSRTYVNRAAKVNKKAQIKESVFLGTDGDIVDGIKSKSGGEKEKKSLILGYVGNLGRSYDFLNVFKALSILKKRGIVDITFILIGDGGERQRIEEF